MIALGKVVVYTLPADAGVAICLPSQEFIDRMAHGGNFAGAPHWFIPEQIRRHTAAGHQPDAVCRFLGALQYGGLLPEEAFEVIRDWSCAHLGTAIETWNLDELPKDRWFRNAWKRSANGGPITIDVRKARPVQWRHIRRIAQKINAARADDFEEWGDPIEVDWEGIRARIKRARDEDELRAVWPDVLPKPA